MEYRVQLGIVSTLLLNGYWSSGDVVDLILMKRKNKKTGGQDWPYDRGEPLNAGSKR